MTKCELPVPRAESGLRANRGSRHPLARSRERPTTRKIMGANLVSAKCVIGCWAQGAWRAPAGSGRCPGAQRTACARPPARSGAKSYPIRTPPCTLRAVCVRPVRSAYEPKIVEHTKSHHRNISFPPISRRITGRLVANARPQRRYRASPAYHFRFSALRGRDVFQGRHPRLPISRARARGRWKFFGTLR